jgi:hypothetical protein
MIGSQPPNPEIGRYQVAACAAEHLSTIAVVDTATGRLWVRQVSNGIGGDKALLKRENQGRPMWDVPK